MKIVTADVIVLGGGITGLTAAHTLRQSNINVLLLEKSERPGGMIDSIEENGYCLETGPTTFQSTGKEIIALCEELGLETVAADSACAKNRYVFRDGKLHTVPMSLQQFFSTSLLSTAGKLRLFSEPLQRVSKQIDESVSTFMERRLGQEPLDYLVGPFLSGVYAGDPDALSMPAVFPKLYQWEREAGSLLNAMLAQEKKPRKMPYQLLNFKDGMKALIQKLEKSVGEDRIHLSANIRHVEFDGSRWTLFSDNTQYQCRCLIMTTPAYVTAKLLESAAPRLSKPLEAIPYTPLSVVHLGFARKSFPNPLEGFGCLVPRAENISLLGAIWSSSLFPNRAPKDQVLLSCFIGGALFPKIKTMSAQEILGQVVKDLGQIFNHQVTPGFSKILSYENAIPQYTLGHLQRVEVIEQHPEPSLALAGNYLRGVALNDCVLSGETAATKIMGYLASAASTTSVSVDDNP